MEKSKRVRLYRTARWQRIREAQLRMQPLCEWCLEREIVEPANEVHHAIPHRGSEASSGQAHSYRHASGATRLVANVKT